MKQPVTEAALNPPNTYTLTKMSGDFRENTLSRRVTVFSSNSFNKMSPSVFLEGQLCKEVER